MLSVLSGDSKSVNSGRMEFLTIGGTGHGRDNILTHPLLGPLVASRPTFFFAIRLGYETFPQRVYPLFSW